MRQQEGIPLLVSDVNLQQETVTFTLRKSKADVLSGGSVNVPSVPYEKSSETLGRDGPLFPTETGVPYSNWLHQDSGRTGNPHRCAANYRSRNTQVGWFISSQGWPVGGGRRAEVVGLADATHQTARFALSTPRPTEDLFKRVYYGTKP
eukprot:970720-Amphidinium_carterae.1